MLSCSERYDNHQAFKVPVSIGENLWVKKNEPIDDIIEFTRG